MVFRLLASPGTLCHTLGGESQENAAVGSVILCCVFFLKFIKILLFAWQIEVEAPWDLNIGPAQALSQLVSCLMETIIDCPKMSNVIMRRILFLQKSKYSFNFLLFYSCCNVGHF